jgi:hypothetical protein
MSLTFPVSIRRANVVDHAGTVGVMASPTKPSLTISKVFDHTKRSSVSSSAVLILDP